MAGGKGHLEINEWIVGDVERIRDVAEETADSLASLASHLRTSTSIHHGVCNTLSI